jgi:hypothetical protein
VFNIYRIITGKVHIRIVNRFDNKPVPCHTVKIKPADEEEKEMTAGSEGVITLNAIEISARLTVTDSADKYNHKDFTVNAEDEEFVFPVELPVIFDPYIKVVTRKDKTIVSAYPLKVEIDGAEQKLYSNREGIIAFTGIEQGCKMLVTDANDQHNYAEFTVDTGAVELIFMVELPEIFALRIKVVNRDDGEPVAVYPLKVKIDENEQYLYSNRDGFITLNQLEKNVKLAIVDGNNPYNNTEFTFDAEMDEYLFPVELIEEKTVKIRLVDKNKEIMPNHIIDVVINGIHYKRTTGEDGKISLPASLFVHGKKVKVEVPITENDRNIKKKNR